jgi:hypothetical protein
MLSQIIWRKRNWTSTGSKREWGDVIVNKAITVRRTKLGVHSFLLGYKIKD